MHRVGLYLGADPLFGGTFQYCQAMLEALANLPSSYELRVLHVYPGWSEKLRELGLRGRQVDVGVWNPTLTKAFGVNRSVLRTWRRIGKRLHPIVRALHEESCDVWVFPSQDPLTYQAGVPAIGVIHDLMHRYESRFPEVSAGARRIYRDIHYHRLCEHSLGVLVDSELGAHHVHESYGTDPRKLHVLPYVAPAYMNNGRDPEEVARRLGLPPRFVFYPAQFWAHKNHLGLVRATALLRDRHPDLTLVFAGGAKNAHASVVDAVQELGLEDRVRYLGYVADEDMPALYRRAVAMVMPTFFGPTNIPPLEGFHAGCPIAVSDIYGMREQCGDAALYFDPQSPASIAETLERLWTDEPLRDTLAAAGRHRSERWGQPQFNERLRAIVTRILEDAP